MGYLICLDLELNMTAIKCLNTIRDGKKCMRENASEKEEKERKNERKKKRERRLNANFFDYVSIAAMEMRKTSSSSTTTKKKKICRWKRAADWTASKRSNRKKREREREEGGGGKSEEKTLRVDEGWWMLLDTPGVNSRTAIHLCPGRKSSPPSCTTYPPQKEQLLETILFPRSLIDPLFIFFLFFLLLLFFLFFFFLFYPSPFFFFTSLGFFPLLIGWWQVTWMCGRCKKGHYSLIVKYDGWMFYV